ATRDEHVGEVMAITDGVEIRLIGELHEAGGGEGEVGGVCDAGREPELGRGPVLGLNLIPVLLVTEDEGGGSAVTDLVGRVASQVRHQVDGVFVGGGMGGCSVGAVTAHHAVVDQTVLGGDLAGGQPGGSGGNVGRFEDDNLQPGSLQQHGGRQAGDPRSGDDH